MPSIAVYSGTYRDITAAFGRQLAGRLSDRSPAERLSLSGIANVLVPSRGTAESLVAEILREQPEGFSGVLVRTIDELARSIVNAAGDFPRVPSDLEQQVVMSEAYSDTDLFGDVEGAASALARSYRDVRDSAMTIDELARKLGKRAQKQQPAIHGAIAIWRRYERGIEQIGGVDPAEILERATILAGQTAQPVAPQTLFGFYDLTGIQRKFIDALIAIGALDAAYVPVPATSGIAEAPYGFAQRLLSHLSSTSQVIPAPVPRAGSREVEVELSAATTRADELRQIAAAVRRLLDGGVSPADIAIVTRSVVDEERILFRSIAAGAGFAFSGARARSVRAQRIGRGITTLLRLRERRFRRSDVIDLLEAGLRPGELGLTVRAREISTIDRVTRRHRISGGTAAQVRSSRRGRREPSSEDLEALRQYVATVEALERVTAGFEPPREGTFWRTTLPQLADLFHLRSDEDLQTIGMIEEIAEAFGRVALLRRSWSAGDVARSLEAQSIPGLPAELPEVWFGDAMRLRGRSFRHLFVFGVEEQRVPQRRAPDALLPDDVRRDSGVREIGDGREEEQLLFALLRDAATETVRYSCALVDVRGNQQRPSRLLRPVALQIDPAAENEIAHDFGAYLRGRRRHEQASSAVPGRRLAAQLLLARSSGQRTHYDGYLTRTPELTAALSEKLLTIAPTHLEEYGECPQRFFFSRILGAREIEDPEDAAELQVNDRGVLWHEVLEEFHQSLSDEEIAGATQALTPELESRLHAVVDRMYDELEVRQPPLNQAIRGIERRAAKRILSAFVTSDLGELQQSGFRPWKFEYRFGRWDDAAAGDSEPLVLDLAGYSLELHGVIDRIDHQVWQRKYRVVDYKSGKARRFEKIAEKIDAGQALQLALYTLAIVKMLELEDHQVSGVIRPLAGGGVEDHFAFELAERRPALESVLGMFLRSISGGIFPAFVATDAKNCRYCAVNHSCRTRYAPNERYALAAYESVLEMLRTSP